MRPGLSYGSPRDICAVYQHLYFRSYFNKSVVELMIRGQPYVINGCWIPLSPVFSLKVPCKLEKEMCALIVDVIRCTKPTYACSIFKPLVKNLRVCGLSLRYSACKAFILTSYAADLFQAAEVSSFFIFLGRSYLLVLVFL